MVGVRADQGHLVRGPGAVERGGHRDRADAVAGHPGGVQTGVGERGRVRLLAGEGGGGGRGAVPGERGADRDDGAVGDRHGDQPVVAGGQVAEALPQGDHRAVADRPDQQPVHRGDRGGVEAEQVPVVGEVAPGGRLWVGGQAGGERRPGGAERVRGAESVPPHVGVDPSGEAALPGVGRGRTGAVVEVGGLVAVVGERAGAARCRGRGVARRGGGGGAAGQQGGDHGGGRQYGDEPASGPARRKCPLRSGHGTSSWERGPTLRRPGAGAVTHAHL